MDTGMDPNTISFTALTIILLITNLCVAIAMFFVGRKHGRLYDIAKDSLSSNLTIAQTRLDETQSELQNVIDQLHALKTVRTAKDIKKVINKLLDDSVLAPTDESK